MNKEQKIYCKIGQAVCNTLLVIGFSTAWIGLIVYSLVG